MEGSPSLPQVVTHLATAGGLEHVAEVVRCCARHLVKADGLSFVIREGSHCYYLEEDAIGPLWKGQRFPVEQCVSGWVMRNDRCVVIPDIYQDPRVPVEAYKPTFVRSMAMVPVGRPTPFAAIGAYWATRHEPTPNQLDVLQALADSAALALSGS